MYMIEVCVNRLVKRMRTNSDRMGCNRLFPYKNVRGGVVMNKEESKNTKIQATPYSVVQVNAMLTKTMSSKSSSKNYLQK